MCRLSYEKCVCFVFLVILAVLSCSGFRIDNIAMTDISKKNSHTSTSSLSSDELFARLFSVESPAHRVRHHRHLRPPPAPATAPPRTRSGQKRNKKHCPELDFSWKVYQAEAIALATVEGRSSHCKESRENCTVQFRVVEWLKNRPPSEDRRLSLTFPTNRTNHCEYEYLAVRSHQFLVRIKNYQSNKEYILFLKTEGPHNFSPVFVPEVSKNKTMKIITRINKPQFTPKPVKVEKIVRGESRSSKRLKLGCKVQGFPIPIIYWYKNNNTLLHPSSRIRITQKKRKSTLLIRNANDTDSENSYMCVARGVDGKTDSQVFPAKRKPGKPCEGPMKTHYCLNGGTCYSIVSIDEYMCECLSGYRGPRCGEKSSDQSSRYRHPSVSTCKVGLYTKYDDC